MATALGGFLANRLRQPVILGYLVNGFVVSPFAFELLSNAAVIQSLAGTSVAFLLFTLGVEFSLAELKRVKKLIALQGSFSQVGLTILLVALVTVSTGWTTSTTQGIFLGAVLSLSSTAVVLKNLTEICETNTMHSQIMLAILIAQDLTLGVMLGILSALNQSENIFVALSLAVLKIVLFTGVAII